MKRLVLAAVLGAVFAVGLYSASADGGTTIGTTIGDESHPMVAQYGPLSNAVNHPCPNGSTITTGLISKDDPILDLCWFVGEIPLPKLPPAVNFAGYRVPRPAPVELPD